MSMELIETLELASSASSITFSSIPQTYTDLKLLISARTDASGTGAAVNLRPNASTSNGSFIQLFGSGSSTGSASGSSVRAASVSGASATSSTFGNSFCYISNYTSSSAKSFSTDTVLENNATEAFQEIYASLWNDTSAITSLTAVLALGGNFVSGSTFSLYGITSGSDGTTTVS